MIGLYFSGTGNSRYCVEKLLEGCQKDAKAYSIEDSNAIPQIKLHDQILFGYPVQYSTIPKILRDYIIHHQELWQGKRIFVIATMGMFSGDGAGILARLLKKYGATIIGGLHLKMPDSICDEKVLKRSKEKQQKLIVDATDTILQVAKNWKTGKLPQQGLSFFSRVMGLVGQRLYFAHKTNNYSNKLKIDIKKCVGCQTCISLCPMKNITLDNRIIKAGTQCTMCYRCINNCPKKAITLLGKEVIAQYDIQNYLS